MKDKVICIMCEDSLDVDSAKFDGWVLGELQYIIKLPKVITYQTALCYSCKIRSI